jgi:hypothetical protein
MSQCAFFEQWASFEHVVRQRVLEVISTCELFFPQA